MREYKAIRTEMGWIVSKKKQMGKLIMLKYLNGYGLRTPNKGTARVFYNEDSARSAIVTMRIKDKKSDK